MTDKPIDIFKDFEKKKISYESESSAIDRQPMEQSLLDIFSINLHLERLIV